MTLTKIYDTLTLSASFVLPKRRVLEQTMDKVKKKETVSVNNIVCLRA